MGYFPNGCAGDDYQETYCFHCVNHFDNNGSGTEGCFIWDLHLFWNRDACNGKDAPVDSSKHAKWEALEHFIPTTKNGIGCEQCKMFVPKSGVEVVVDKTDALKEWESLYGRRQE